MPETVVTRDYRDNFSVKEYTENELMNKYFSDIDPSLRTVGMIGYTTELIANFGEDTFNTGSVLFRESFPNRAQIPESIYSHAAIFQLSNVFSTAASCKFLLVVQEAAILKNMLNDYDKDTGIYHFFIDKNTTIYVEDKSFVLDYDIRMNIVKKTTEKGDDYLFTASYIMDDYVNSISELTDPYVKIRRSSDGYMALEVQTHQCTRDVRYETLISNSAINFPTIDVDFEGKLAGFDILYKPSTSTGYTQLKTQIIYSQATSEPFCYYQMLDENTLRISFNSKDNYFMPEFNSELKIILYITEGQDGNFTVYTGNDISLVPDNENYPYANTYLTAAQPFGSSENGQDQMDIDALQQITVEQYRTANALTTENDLTEFFNNYKYRYGNSSVMVIKKRNDVYERVYSAFLVIKNNEYIYHTNTLNLKLNLSDMQNPEKNIYTLEPGCLFTCNENNGYAEFFRDEQKNAQYKADYDLAVKNNEIQYITDKVLTSEIPAYLDRPASFAEFKKRHGLDDKVSVFDLEQDVLETIYDQPRDGKFMIINPFLIRFKKDPNLVSIYMTYVTNTSLVDFTNQNENSYVQFVLYMIRVNRRFARDKKYEITTSMGPSIAIDAEYPIIEAKKDQYGRIEEYVLNDKYSVVNNDVRVIMLIKDDAKNICFTELYPTSFISESNTFGFSGEIFTDDHITSEGKMRILSGVIYRNPIDGTYYKVHSDDATLYDLYNKDDEITATDIPVDEVTKLRNEGKIKQWCQVYNMTTANDILIPMSDATCEIYTLYRRIYSPDEGKLVLTTDDQTNNIFTDYDPTLKGYIWTNEYSTASSPITFMKPLNNVRTYLSFEDYTAAHIEKDENGDDVTVFEHDIMDVEMKSIPFVRAKLAYDNELLDYFMNAFFAQYNFFVDIMQTKLRNETAIDVKFYNTYGRSKDFLIGESNDLLDTVNLALSFDVWFVSGTDLLTATPAVKDFIKREVEKINSNGMNNLYISNLMRKIEITFAYVDHIRFNKINAYDETYQAVKNYVSDLNDLTVEERRFYVPELLVCDLNDITINEYYVS